MHLEQVDSLRFCLVPFLFQQGTPGSYPYDDEDRHVQTRQNAAFNFPVSLSRKRDNRQQRVFEDFLL